MAIIDNSETNQMNSEQIKETITSVVKASAAKSVSEAAYDKTILATIQCCTDVSLGQYKVKYQDSYFTAYAKDTTKKYSNNAVVYVLVPGNDMTSRMFITGLANDDFNQQSSLDNLELDQQFTNRSINIINMINTDLDMSTYWGAPDVYTKTLYKYTEEEDEISNNYIDINNDLFLNYINKLDEPYIRLGCAFKTEIEPDRKISGNYGIRLRLKFKDGDYKDYVISSYYMSGSPFNFSSFVPQYNIWSVDKENIERIEAIEEFVEGFPPSTDTPKIDIHLSDLSLTTCQRIFNVVNNNTIEADIACPEGTIFGNTGESQPITRLTFEGVLYYKGNLIKDNDNKLEVYWGREDVTVNSVGHSKYNSALGPGWYCLNTANRIKANGTETSETLQNTTIEPTDVSYAQGDFEWNSQRKITLHKSLFYGKKTQLKCAIIYENNIYHREIDITNKDGFYLLMQTEDGFDSFFDRRGTSTIIAGVFEDLPHSNVPEPHLFSGIWDEREYTITYNWAKEEAVTPRIRKSLPINTSEYYPSSPLDKDNAPWSSDLDNEDKTETEVETYFTTYFPNEVDRNTAKRCIERYDFYNRKLTSYQQIPNPTQEEQEKIQICKDRLYGADGPPEIIGIIPANETFVRSLYREGYENSGSFYILGPSTFTGIYDETKTASDKDYQNYYNYASIDTSTVVHNYWNTPLYDAENTNTLYKINGYSVGSYTDFIVTAFINFGERDENDKFIVTESHSIGTNSIRLSNATGTNLKYTLQIVNGDRVFPYDENGLLTAGVQCLPLSFKLINQKGVTIFDSANQSSGDNTTNLTTLAPKWRFPFKETLLKVLYRPESESMSESNIICYKDNNTYVVQNQSFFNYNVADSFNVNYKDNNTIELEVQYDNSVITASTNFSFIKQGEMGTNGTDYNLLIRDMSYDKKYKEYVLANSLYSTFENIIYDKDGNKTNIKNTYIFSPENRHLKNVYLYATHCYSNGINWDPNDPESGLPQEDGIDITDIGDDNVRYVNLNLSGIPTPDGTDERPPSGVLPNPSALLQAQIYENGSVLVDESINVDWSKIKFNENQLYITDNIKLDSSPSFDISTSSDLVHSGNVEIAYHKGNQNFGLKPSRYIYEVSDGSKTYSVYEIANNIVQSKASINIASQDATRDIYTFYSIPFYYFSVHRKKQDNTWENITPENLDPARHIVVTGGFDEVIYNEAGANPVYNKQNDFRVYLYDENGDSILDEIVLQDIDSITWTCSDGFLMEQKPDIIDYTATSGEKYFKPNEDLYGKYCEYNNKIYHCIEHHIKEGQKTIKIGDTPGQVYESDAFVEPYWEEIQPANLQLQTQKFTPLDSYRQLVKASLLNDWICVTIKSSAIERDNGEIYMYNAQAFIPINVLCNRYGSQILNDWNGKSTEVGEGYVVTRQVAAGHKNGDNNLVGITIGDNFYPGSNGTGTDVSGIFGYGMPAGDNNLNNWTQTLFIDANTGKAVFGTEGVGQIILDTNPNGWDRIGGWYFNKDYLYKPYYTSESSIEYKDLGINITDFMTSNDPVLPPSKRTDPSKYPVESQLTWSGAGLYVPMQHPPQGTDPFIWAGATEDSKNTAKFRVDYSGILHCEDADIQGNISADSGNVGCLNINSDKSVSIKYNNVIRFKATEEGVQITGNIQADEGMFGPVQVNQNIILPDGWQMDDIFNPNIEDFQTREKNRYLAVNKPYYPWRMVTRYERFDDDSVIYPDVTKSMIPYVLYGNSLSIPQEPQKHINSTDSNFSDRAGKCVFFRGDLYALGGRISNWIFDSDRMSTPQSNTTDDQHDGGAPYIDLRSKYTQTGTIGNYGNSDYRSNVGYISVGRYNSTIPEAYLNSVTMWGDGSIEGQYDYQDGTIVERSWIIKGDGVANFTLSRADSDADGSKFKGQFWTNNFVEGSTGTKINTDGILLDPAKGMYINDSSLNYPSIFTLSSSNNKYITNFSGPISVDGNYVRLDEDGIRYDDFFNIKQTGMDFGSHHIVQYNQQYDTADLEARKIISASYENGGTFKGNINTGTMTLDGEEFWKRIVDKIVEAGEFVTRIETVSTTIDHLGDSAIGSVTAKYDKIN